jgi:hypothetical protein
MALNDTFGSISLRRVCESVCVCLLWCTSGLIRNVSELEEQYLQYIQYCTSSTYEADGAYF